MSFNNEFKFAIPLWGGNELWVTETTIGTWIIGILLILLAVAVRLCLKNFKDIPKGFQNIIELGVETFDNFCISTMTARYAYFGRWFFGVFCFILFANLSGLIGFRPPTADLSTTAAFAIVSFFMIHIGGMVSQKGAYFKEYLRPIPVFLPMNIISEAATPVSLSFRLFGNILGGLIIMDLIYGMFPWFLKFGIPAALHVYFDIFAGCLQAFIFCILSMTFISGKLGIED